MDVIDYLNNFNRFGDKGGFKPGLKRIRALMEAFNHPENKINIIHVAGSNGKGSTIAFLNSIYQQAGYKVGMYTSPHILSFTERIQINGQHISKQELTELIEIIKPVIADISNRLGKPSFFEVVTTLAFLYFFQEQVDIVLLEVGLGGRLDATSIIKSPLASVITGISLEHTSILGDTLEQIAREKAGIIKKGCPVITGVREQKALTVIENIASKKKAHFYNIYDVYSYKLKESSLDGMSFSLKHRDGEVAGYLIEGDYFIGLAGEHQIRNAILAMSVVARLQDEFPVAQSVLKEGLKKAYIPGRMEVICKKPLLLLDGAHNVEGIESLVSFLQTITKRNLEITFNKIYIVFAVLKDKDLKGMLDRLTGIKNIELIITRNNNCRALAPANIIKLVEQKNISYQVFARLRTAYKHVCKKAGDNDIIVITGSLYTVAEAKSFLDQMIEKPEGIS